MPSDDTDAPLPVELATSQAATKRAATVLAGTVARRHEADLAFRVAGVIRTITVDIGDVVRPGAIIATLDPGAERARHAAARAATVRAARTLERFDTLAEAGATARSRAEDQRSALLEARAAEAGTRFELRSTTLIAPVGGPVLMRLRQPGETVAAGEAILRIADTRSPLLLRVQVPETGTGAPALGTAAHVRFDGIGLVKGQVSRIAPLVNIATGTRQVEISLPSRIGLVSGMIGMVTFPVLARADGTIRVPAEALALSADGRSLVYVVDRRRAVAHARRVTFVRFDGDDALVTGIAAGLAVITAGAGYVRDGQSVRIAPRAS